MLDKHSSLFWNDEKIIFIIFTTTVQDENVESNNRKVLSSLDQSYKTFYICNLLINIIIR